MATLSELLHLVKLKNMKLEADLGGSVAARQALAQEQDALQDRQRSEAQSVETSADLQALARWTVWTGVETQRLTEATRSAEATSGHYRDALSRSWAQSEALQNLIDTRALEDRRKEDRRS